MLRKINFSAAIVWFLCAGLPGRAAKQIYGQPLSGRQAWSSVTRSPFVNGDAASPGEKAGKHDAIVIGLVGGFVGRNNAVHSPVQLAQKLKQEYPKGVHVEVFENRRREEAHQKILEMLKKENGGALSEEARKNARIVIYGMSWGGSETVALARELGAEKIPVLLTVQVDSVAKAGQDDGVIPANVAEAANFYQNDGLLHGRAEIHAADTARTRILGNFHYSYKTHPVNCPKYPWWDRLFAKYHTEIECDPEVWGRVEELIRSKLPIEKGTETGVH